VSRVFFYALLAAVNPTLLTATTVLLFLPNPKRLLLGYLLGALTTGITVGLAIVYWLKSSGTVSTTQHTVSPIIDVVLGTLALVIAFVLATGRTERLTARRRARRAGRPKKTPAWRRRLDRGSVRATYVVGLLLSFPGAAYLACLTQISKQNLSAGGVVVMVVAVNLLMLTLIEVPLVAYTVAPRWTRAEVERIKAWLGRNGREFGVIAASVIGVIFLTRAAVEVWS
jgi:hypothetical protein